MPITSQQLKKLNEILQPRYGRSLSEGELNNIHIILMQWAEILIEISNTAEGANNETPK